MPIHRFQPGLGTHASPQVRPLLQPLLVAVLLLTLLLLLLLKVWLALQLQLLVLVLQLLLLLLQLLQLRQLRIQPGQGLVLHHLLLRIVHLHAQHTLQTSEGSRASSRNEQAVA